MKVAQSLTENNSLLNKSTTGNKQQTTAGKFILQKAEDIFCDIWKIYTYI